MNLTKQESINLLINLFDSNKLSFRQINSLRRYFDEAVEQCNEARSEAIADWHMGRTSKPELADASMESDFWYSLEVDATMKFKEKGIEMTGKALDAVVEYAAEVAEFGNTDFFYTTK